MSGADYTIYANGYNDFVNNCELSDFEDVTNQIGSSEATAMVMPYDGELVSSFSGSGLYRYFKLIRNNTSLNVPAWSAPSAGGTRSYSMSVKKNDKLYITDSGGSGTFIMYAQFYNLRDYSNR